MAKVRMRIKKGDKVVVISGADKSTTPHEVLHVMAGGQKVVVQGVNMRWKHQRPSQVAPKGGRTRQECPIHISNVLLFSEKAGKGVRTRVEITNGKKIRVGRPCGTKFD